LTSGPRILLVRTSAIGDIVFASPLIAAFRRAYPRGHLAWLLQPECESLLSHHPDLDEVIVWPYRHWRDLWRDRRWADLARALRGFRAELRRRRFDLAVDLQGLLKSGLLAWLSGAPERIGLGSREGSQWLMTRTIPRGGNARRIGSEYLFLAETLGLPTDDFSMAIHYGPDEARYADGFVRREGLADGFAVICPFTTRPQKHWFEPRWVELAGLIRAELGLPVVMLGGPGDLEGAGRIRAQAGGGLIDVVGKTSLLQAASIIDRCALLVGVDTGLGHMGIAFRRPSLLLFGATRPYLDTGRADARVLYHALPCSPCRRRPTCNGEFTCMTSIEPGEVLSAAREILGHPA